MVCAGDAVFDDAGNVIQLRVVLEDTGENGRSAGVGGKIDGEKADAAEVHAARGTPVVSQRQGVEERT